MSEQKEDTHTKWWISTNCKENGSVCSQCEKAYLSASQPASDEDLEKVAKAIDATIGICTYKGYELKQTLSSHGLRLVKI